MSIHDETQEWNAAPAVGERAADCIVRGGMPRCKTRFAVFAATCFFSCTTCSELTDLSTTLYR